MNAMILCAGLGTRFLPVTEVIAKPAIPFLNIPLLGYSLFHIEKEQTKNIVLNTHHLPKTIEVAAREIANAAKRPARMQFSREPEILGSGGGIRAAEKYLSNEEFVVANGDEVILFSHGKSFEPLIEFHRKSKALATLLVTDHPEAGYTMGGVWADANNRITRLGEKSGERPNEKSGASGAKHFAGVFVFSPRIFDFMPPDGAFHIFNDCLIPAIRSGENVMAFYDPKLLWLDTTNVKAFINSTNQALEKLAALPTDNNAAINAHPHASELLAIQKRYGHELNRVGETQWMAPGAQFSGSLSIRAHLLMGENSQIASGVEVKNFAVIGAGARFSQGVIDSSVIAPKVHVNELVGLKRQVIV